MDTEFMPMSLTGLSAQSRAQYAKANATDYSELEKLGITVKDEDDQFGLNFEDFLQLMVQQLQNQTMDNTADTGEMLNQMVQMSTVQMLATVQDSMEALINASSLSYSASLVGKTVTVGKLDSDGNLQEVVGKVTGTGTYQGAFVIFLDDNEMYYLNDIMAVGTLPDLPEEPGESTNQTDTTVPTDQTNPGDGETDPSAMSLH
ncbi:flagellar hook capping FlgD N-terminal domain-containing protein [Candidatus Avoscillospira sp. LCP25S3_F1]|uniref:flagellar hook capping FlgD N-terminal domain-containing protein n=1 Tax=Candidatus Avoscillospira sp. LCP25S3_F1 TaxID=3438825 RepID=UPI003F8F3FF2